MRVVFNRSLNALSLVESVCAQHSSNNAADSSSKAADISSKAAESSISHPEKRERLRGEGSQIQQCCDGMNKFKLAGGRGCSAACGRTISWH